MKKTFFFFAFIFSISANLIAQGNLQFNQVKLVGTTTETVPVGKVWKVESAIGSFLMSACNTNINSLHTILVNGNRAVISKGGDMIFDAYCYGWEGVTTVTELPLWLPAGATLAAEFNISSLSVIEFNIVP